MEKIVLEKVITFSSPVENLVKASLKDSLNYQLSEDGVSAVGVIKITGNVQTLKGYENFNESLDVDIFAPFEQIIDKSKFALKIEDFTYQIIRNNLIFKIEVSVNGFRKLEIETETNTYNLTNEIDEEITENKNMYDQSLINDFKEEPVDPQINEEQTSDTLPQEIVDFIKSESRDDNSDDKDEIKEKIDEEKKVILDNDEIIEEQGIETEEEMKAEQKQNKEKFENINIKLTSSSTDETLAKSWADDLFKLKDSYVLFYRIHRLVDGESSANGEKFIIFNEVKQ